MVFRVFSYASQPHVDPFVSAAMAASPLRALPPTALATPEHPTPGRTPGTGWTFLTNHAMVLLCLAQDSSARLRDVADTVGITERAVQHIVSDLEAEGFLRRTRDGRRNRYALDLDQPLRREMSRGHTVRELLALVTPVAALDAARGRAAAPAGSRRGAAASPAVGPG